MGRIIFLVVAAGLVITIPALGVVAATIFLVWYMVSNNKLSDMFKRNAANSLEDIRASYTNSKVEAKKPTKILESSKIKAISKWL